MLQRRLANFNGLDHQRETGRPIIAPTVNQPNADREKYPRPRPRRTDERRRAMSPASSEPRSPWRTPILVINIVSAIRCVAAGALTGRVRIHAAACRCTRVGRAGRCAAGCACCSTSATGTGRRSTTSATGATTSATSATAATLCPRGGTQGDCCKERKRKHFSYRHAGLHIGYRSWKTATARIVPVCTSSSNSIRAVGALSDD